ncbi:MAG TPA: AarF/UbiB family protein [Rubrobacter sp.]|nr:AarF/UbiB family protein [Rubrobacter sp.]
MTLGPWGEAALGAREVLARATRRSAAEWRDAVSAGVTDPAAPFRLGDLSRAQWFLWTGASLAAGERAGRGAPSGGVPSPRALVLGTIAADLYLGYTTLRERGRWLPGTVGQEDWELAHRRGAGRLLDAAEALGGTLIKAGQFASSRPDLLPPAYTGELASLQDRVPPQPAGVIEEAVARELGRPIADVFSRFDREPVAAASIAQVHRATLRDGRDVAVKVQYPGIPTLIEADLEALESIFDAIAGLEPDVRLQPIADYLRWTLPLELDFGREAGAMAGLRRTLAHRADVVVPEVVEGMTTERLLVMDFVEGIRISDREAILAAGIDTSAVAETLNDAFAEGLFRRGVLHADPHPGNLLVQPGTDGPRLVLLDHGLTMDLEPSFVATLSRMVGAMREGDMEGLTLSLGETGLPVGPETDVETLLGVVGVLLGGGRQEARPELGELGRGLGASVGDLPPRLLLVGRAIGLLDGITRTLDPDLDVLEIVARHTDD